MPKTILRCPPSLLHVTVRTERLGQRLKARKSPPNIRLITYTWLENCERFDIFTRKKISKSKSKM